MDIDCRVSRPTPEQVDSRRDSRVARLAAKQWGVVSIHELRGCGLSDDAVLVRVRAGWLHPLHRGVYAVGHDNPPLEGRFLAAVKAWSQSLLESLRGWGSLWNRPLGWAPA